MKKLLLGLALLTCVIGADAQQFEIRLAEPQVPNGQLFVQMRPIGGVVPTTGNFFTDMQFAIKGPDSLALSQAVLTGPNGASPNGQRYQLAIAWENAPFTGDVWFNETFGEYYLPVGWCTVCGFTFFPENWTPNEWQTVAIFMAPLPPSPPSSQSQSQSLALLYQIAPLGFGVDDGVGTGPNVGVDLIDYEPQIVADGVLPLTLLSFQADKAQETSVKITWTTADERNASHFDVERSTDARTWTSIGQVEAAGYTTQTVKYSFDDVDVYDGRRPNARFYYRLRMVDRDNAERFSHIDVVKFDKEGNGNSSIYVFPNPSVDGLNVEFDLSDEGSIPEEMTLVNALGQVVFTGIVPEGSEIEYIDYSKMNIGPGTYVLRVTDTDNVIIGQSKVIVQDR